MVLSFFSMVFLSTKGLRVSSCLVRERFIEGWTWGDERIRW